VVVALVLAVILVSSFILVVASEHRGLGDHARRAVGDDLRDR